MSQQSSNPRNVTVEGPKVIVHWADEERSSFHAIWLRDNCPCSECFHAGTGERILDTASQPDAPRPSSVRVDDGGIEIVWTRCGASWPSCVSRPLARRIADGCRHHGSALAPARAQWKNTASRSMCGPLSVGVSKDRMMTALPCAFAARLAFSIPSSRVVAPNPPGATRRVVINAS